MSFKKIQLIDPTTIGCPEQGHIYLGRDDIGLWEKRDNCDIVYLSFADSGSTDGIDGTSGSSGRDGNFFGSSGTSGASGKSGTSGTSGKTGTSGTSGKTGTSGTSGQGTSGSSGTSGAAGASGTSGSSGETGTSGTSGNGSSGTSGVGSSGTSGINGGYGGATRMWTYTSSNTPSSPGLFYAYNSAYGSSDLSLINEIRINVRDYDLKNVSDWIRTWNSGVLKIEDRRNFACFGIYFLNNASINTSNPNYYIITGFTFVVSSGVSLTEGDNYLISSIPAGNSGTSGTSGHGTSGTSGVGPTGDNGTSGTSGLTGTSGTSGTSGLNGTSGTSGKQGTSGTSGSSGTSGANGTSGTSGLNGTSGTSGKQGTSGTSGLTGTSGTSGKQGTSGTSGIQGTSGTSGTSVSGVTDADFYYDTATDTLYTPSITVSTTINYPVTGYDTKGNVLKTDGAGKAVWGINSKSFTWVIRDPAAGLIPGPRLYSNATPKRIDYYVSGGTNAVFTVTSNNNSLTSGSLTATTTPANTTTFGGTGSLDADSWLRLNISATSGSPYYLTVTIAATDNS